MDLLGNTRESQCSYFRIYCLSAVVVGTDKNHKSTAKNIVEIIYKSIKSGS